MIIKRKHRRPLATLLAIATINWVFPQHDVLAAAPKPIGDYWVAAPTLPTPGRLPAVADAPTRRTVRVSVSAYSSTRDQTDADPFTTASGAKVHEGTIAMNGVPFGTRVRLPNSFGNKVFVVEDRMSGRYGRNHADIWMPTLGEALKWGRRTVTVEILQ